MLQHKCQVNEFQKYYLLKMVKWSKFIKLQYIYEVITHYGN